MLLSHHLVSSQEICTAHDFQRCVMQTTLSLSQNISTIFWLVCLIFISFAGLDLSNGEDIHKLVVYVTTKILKNSDPTNPGSQMRQEINKIFEESHCIFCVFFVQLSQPLHQLVWRNEIDTWEQECLRRWCPKPDICLDLGQRRVHTIKTNVTGRQVGGLKTRRDLDQS